MKTRLSLTTFIFGILAVTALVYVVAIFFTNYNVHSAIELSIDQGLTLEAISPSLNRTAALAIIFVMIILTSVFLITAVILFQRVILPVKKLERAFRELTDGNLNTKVIPDGLAEIRRIGLDFNDATKTIREKNKAVVAAQSELKAAHEKLEREYAETKKLNDIMINRELDMIKLKNEIKELKAAAGAPSA